MAQLANTADSVPKLRFSDLEIWFDEPDEHEEALEAISLVEQTLEMMNAGSRGCFTFSTRGYEGIGVWLDGGGAVGWLEAVARPPTTTSPTAVFDNFDNPVETVLAARSRIPTRAAGGRAGARKAAASRVVERAEARAAAARAGMERAAAANLTDPEPLYFQI